MSDASPYEETKRPFIAHLQELRQRLLVSLSAFVVVSVIAFLFFQPIITILTRHFKEIESAAEQRLFVTTLFEGFTTKVKVSLIAGFILSFPLHLYNTVRFIFPALTLRERRVVAISLVVSFIIVIASAYLTYFMIIPIAVSFLTNASFIPNDVGLLLGYEQNVFYVFAFLFWSILVFQLPVLLEALMILNVVKRKTVFHAARYIIVGVFVISALVSPPDVVSQIAIALPLTLLFGLSLLIAKIAGFGEDR